MKNKLSRTFLLGILLTTSQINAQNSSLTDKKMEWFQDAKLGIFIHWGIYSVNGISESWSFLIIISIIKII